MNQSTIIEIGNYLVSSEILLEKFKCDILKCRGACCIIGDSGAPLEQEECKILEEEFGSISKHLREEGIATIKEQWPFILDIDDDFVTPLIEGNECAYAVFNDDGICFCGIEVANRKGVTSFRKPISCWLYPIRVSHLSSGMTALNLHRWYLCDQAYAKGNEEGIEVFRFLQKPIIFAYGRDFYAQLYEAHKMLTQYK